MPRRLAITKRVSLEGLAEGWTSDAYALVSAATHAEYRDLMGISNDDKLALVDFQDTTIEKHLISGKVFILDDQGSMVLDDMQPDDAAQNNDLSNRLFAEIIGVTADPKGIPVGTSTEMTSLPTSEPLIEQ